SSSVDDDPKCILCGAASPQIRIESHVTKSTPGSPLYTLLNSNNPPKASELPLVYSATAELSEHLVSLDEEISQLQDRLVQLNQDRSVLARQLRRHEAILSPIRRAPPEILGEIFSWTLPCSFREANLEDCDFDLTRSPWVLTHVCSLWRAVAISMPSLWSLILLRYDHDHKAHYPLAAVQTHV
ncbi:hypothetical protein FB45DRAFT_1128074, partial [Roridomyces roridus]